MTSDRTLSLESHYICNYNNNENYTNLNIPDYVYLPLPLNNDFCFI